MMNMQGKVVIVTGGASGMGENTVRLLIASGAKVVFTDIDARRGEAIADELGENGVFKCHDTSCEDDWVAITEFAEARFGRIDGLMNNAGVPDNAAVTDIEVEKVMKVMRVNQLGYMLGIKHVVPAMRRTGGGSIVNIGSETGTRGAPGMIAYSATKAAIAGMTRTASAELARDKIRVNLVAPGPVATQMMTEGMGEDFVEKIADAVPLGRVGLPGDISTIVTFLLSDNTSFITGAEIAVDGGRTAAPSRSYF